MELHVNFTNSARYKCLEDLQRYSVDLYLSYCGIEDVAPGHHFGPHVRTEYVIHIVTKGKGTFRCERDTYTLTENMAFLIYPGIETEYEADMDCPWSYAWVGFNGVKAYVCAANAGFTQSNPVSSIVHSGALVDCIKHMLDAHQLSFVNELKRGSQLMRFFSILIEDYSNTHSNRINYDYPGAIYVNQAIDYMEKKYPQKIKINDLANYIGINRCYLTNTFKKILNISPKEFLVNLRLEKAASLLQKTALPINSISAQVGYDDPLAFSKIFKQKYGLSPKAFRKTPETLMQYKSKDDHTNLRSL